MFQKERNFDEKLFANRWELIFHRFTFHFVPSLEYPPKIKMISSSLPFFRFRLMRAHQFKNCTPRDPNNNNKKSWKERREREIIYNFFAAFNNMRDKLSLSLSPSLPIRR
jgi:hypothetical protein